MSLATKKVKETKGKQKLLPKLKTILANPNKTKCPTLNEQELDYLGTMLKTAREKSKLEQKCFATSKGIQLGLESCLRSINGERSSCVFISLSIKPSHIVSLVARNAQVKDETQPIYAQPRLEDFTEHVFGIRALGMVFPKDLKQISDEISQWVEERKKPKKVTKVVLGQQNPLKKKIKKKIVKNAIVMKNTIEIEEQKPSTKTKSWSGDFVSFSSSDNVDINKLKIGDGNVLDALTEIIDKVPIKSKIAEKTEPMEIVYSENNEQTEKIESSEVLEDSDDFLGEYKSLTVHKIKGNPDKKPKKKRKKNNKNKQKSK